MFKIFVFLILIFQCLYTYAETLRFGGFLSLPNRFWPNTIDTQKRSVIFDPNDPESHVFNPDILCEEYDARLPSAAEIDTYYIGFGPFSNGSPGGLTPFHWSHYENNDISKPLRKRNEQLAQNSLGGFHNEWRNKYEINLFPGDPLFDFKHRFAESLNISNTLVTEPFDSNGLGVIPFTNAAMFAAKQDTAYHVICVIDNVPIN